MNRSATEVLLSQGFVFNKTLSPRACTGKNARFLLKNAFPSTAFNVKTPVRTLGDIMEVSWVGCRGTPKVDEVSDALHWLTTGCRNEVGALDKASPEVKVFQAKYGCVRFLRLTRTSPTAVEKAKYRAINLNQELPIANQAKSCRSRF